jgi:DNA-binding CsgD family transcriptional regulator
VPAIAGAVFLSQSTVRNHLARVYRKLGVGSQQELINLLRDNETDSEDRGG